MDQNADGTVDQNPLTKPFTGLTPGDVYAAPMPTADASHVLQAATSARTSSSVRRSIRIPCR